MTNRDMITNSQHTVYARINNKLNKKFKEYVPVKHPLSLQDSRSSNLVASLDWNLEFINKLKFNVFI